VPPLRLSPDPLGRHLGSPVVGSNLVMEGRGGGSHSHPGVGGGTHRRRATAAATAAAAATTTIMIISSPCLAQSALLGVRQQKLKKESFNL